MDVSITGLYDLINREAQDDAALIAALEGIQARYRHLPFEALVLASERLGVPLSQANSATKHPVGLMNWLARQLAQPFAM